MTKREDVWYIIAYLIPIVSGIIVLFLKGEADKRFKFHSLQSILLGAFMVVIWVIFGIITLVLPFFWVLTSLLILFLWLYGLYVGLEAHNGIDIRMPYITDYAKKYSKYSPAKQQAAKSNK